MQTYANVIFAKHSPGTDFRAFFSFINFSCSSMALCTASARPQDCNWCKHIETGRFFQQFPLDFSWGGGQFVQKLTTWTWLHPNGFTFRSKCSQKIENTIWRTPGTFQACMIFNTWHGKDMINVVCQGRFSGLCPIHNGGPVMQQ